MEKKYNKEDLNIDKLINLLHKYNYNYKAINIDIINKKDNYVNLEINVINDDGNNINNKKYKKYTKKYNRKKHFSKKSLMNLKYNYKFINENKNYKNKPDNNQIKIVKDLENYKLDLSKKDKKENKNYNILEVLLLYSLKKIINSELNIYNNIIKKFKDFINLKKVNIINGTLWKPKDVEDLLDLLLNKVNTIFKEYNNSFFLNNKNKYNFISISLIFFMKSYIKLNSIEYKGFHSYWINDNFDLEYKNNLDKIKSLYNFKVNNKKRVLL